MKAEITQPRFAVCIENAVYVDDLNVRTVYRVLPDESAARSNYIRIVDETGEDYLYPAENFVLIDVPPEAQKALIQTPVHSSPLSRKGRESAKRTTESFSSSLFTNHDLLFTTIFSRPLHGLTDVDGPIPSTEVLG
jgi:hypothetical protein